MIIFEIQQRVRGRRDGNIREGGVLFSFVQTVWKWIFPSFRAQEKWTIRYELWFCLAD